MLRAGPQRHDFGMRSRVVLADRSVPSFAYHVLAENQHGTHRHLAVGSGTPRQFQRSLHEVNVARHSGARQAAPAEIAGRQYADADAPGEQKVGAQCETAEKNAQCRRMKHLKYHPIRKSLLDKPQVIRLRGRALMLLIIIGCPSKLGFLRYRFAVRHTLLSPFLTLILTRIAPNAPAQRAGVPFWGARASVPAGTPFGQLKHGEFLWMGDAVTSGPVVMVVSIVNADPPAKARSPAL